jgi:hypothetical protein
MSDPSAHGGEGTDSHVTGISVFRDAESAVMAINKHVEPSMRLAVLFAVIRNQPQRAVEDSRRLWQAAVSMLGPVSVFLSKYSDVAPDVNTWQQGLARVVYAYGLDEQEATHLSRTYEAYLVSLSDEIVDTQTPPELFL